jgi:hypothetical protein
MNDKLIQIEQEVWKSIIGYSEYKISNFGNIKSINTGLTKFGNKSNKKDRLLKFDLGSKNNKNKSKYYVVNLCNSNGCKKFKVHILTAKHFVENDNFLLKNKVNHKDGNTFNNYYKNLEWTTQRENVHHAINSVLPKCVSVNKVGKFIVRIYHNNKRKHIGCFDDIEQAILNRNNFLKDNNIQSKYL